MNTHPFHILAQASLKKQHTLTKQLLNVLKQEYKTLTTHQGDPLDEFIHEKQSLIIDLNALNQHWLALVTAESHETNPQGIELFLKKYDEDSSTTLSDQWSDLQNMAKDCQKANTVNGTIITLRYKATQQTLSILRGQVPGDSIYDPSGNSLTGYASGGNSLARA